jgi:hypothetical protein
VEIEAALTIAEPRGYKDLIFFARHDLALTSLAQNAFQPAHEHLLQAEAAHRQGCGQRRAIFGFA